MDARNKLIAKTLGVSSEEAAKLIGDEEPLSFTDDQTDFVAAYPLHDAVRRGALEDVLLHRMRLRYEALAEGISGVSVLKEILSEAG